MRDRQQPCPQLPQVAPQAQDSQPPEPHWPIEVLETGPAFIAPCIETFGIGLPNWPSMPPVWTTFVPDELGPAAHSVATFFGRPWNLIAEGSCPDAIETVTKRTGIRNSSSRRILLPSKGRYRTANRGGANPYSLDRP